MAAVHTSKADFVERGLQLLPPPDPECSICHEELQAPSPSAKITKDLGYTHVAVKVVDCGHIFGAECLGTWLKTSNTCPMCRRVLFPQDVQRSAQSYLSIQELAAGVQDVHLFLDAGVQHFRTQRQVFEALVRVREQLTQDSQQRPGDAEVVPADSVSESRQQSNRSLVDMNDRSPDAMQILRYLHMSHFETLMSTLEPTRRFSDGIDEQHRAGINTANNVNGTSIDQFVVRSDTEGDTDNTLGDRIEVEADSESNIDSIQGQLGSVIDEEHRELAIGYSDGVGAFSALDSRDQASNFDSLMGSHSSIVAHDGSILDFQSGDGEDDKEGWVDDNESVN